MAIYDQILGISTSQDWAALGINLLLSTLIGGIVIIALLAIASRAFGDRIKLPNAFLMVLLINLINLFGILAFLSPLVPMAGLILPVLVWILLTKAFFSEMSWKHALIIGIIGYALSILLIPNLVGYFSAYIPSF